MQRRMINRGVKSRDFTISAPIKGLNAKDAVSAMPPLYAIRMDNYIPLDNKVSLRNGYSLYAQLGTDRTGVDTLASYQTATNKKFIALYGKKAWDITTPTKVKELSVVFSETRCQTFQYKDRLFFMNGIDTPKVYYIDEMGTEHFEDWKFTSSSMQPQRIISGNVSKEFVWFIEKGSTKAWYSAVAGNVQGELKQFDIAQVCKHGGELVAIANWTIDGGIGIDDLTVFITSAGEVLVYSGSNPNDANDWKLKGSYIMSKPIGYKCLLPYQGDIVIISEDGYIPLSRALAMQNSGQSTYAFSDTIRGLVIERTANNSDRQGWQGIVYSKKGYAIFNVPVNQQFEQHVINVNTGAWCRFTNIRSICWCIFDNHLYFGSDNSVFKFGESYSDNGTPIEGWIEQAYNNLGSASIKKIQLINPRTKSSTGFGLTIYTNMDFEERKVNYFTNIGDSGQTKWDTAKWSSTANPIGTKWSTLKATTVQSQWLANSATGVNVSIVFKTKTKGNNIEWYDTGLRFEYGNGIL